MPLELTSRCRAKRSVPIIHYWFEKPVGTLRFAHPTLPGYRAVE